MRLRKCIIFIFITLNSFFVFSQNYDYSPNKKAKKLYSQAQKKYTTFNLKDALGNLEQAVQIDPQYRDAYIFLADLQIELADYCNAALNLSKALNLYNNPKEKLLMKKNYMMCDLLSMYLNLSICQ
jgi:Tfp pilus assembly protein PilF